MAIFTPLLPCILCAIDLSSEIYNIDGGGAPPLPKVDPACATHTPRTTAEASAGHGSPSAPAWLAMCRLPLRPKGVVRTRLPGWDGSNLLRRCPRLHETNQEKQASMEGLSRERCLCRSLALLPISAIGAAVWPSASSLSLLRSVQKKENPLPLRSLLYNSVNSYDVKKVRNILWGIAGWSIV